MALLAINIDFIASASVCFFLDLIFCQQGMAIRKLLWMYPREQNMLTLHIFLVLDYGSSLFTSQGFRPMSMSNTQPAINCQDSSMS